MIEIGRAEACSVERRPGQAAALVAGGLALLAIATLLLGHPRHEVPVLERQVFEAINRLPDALRPVLIVEMQLGTVGAIFVVAGGLAIFGRRRGAVAAIVGGLLAWTLTKGVKAAVERGRPAEVLADARVRQGDLTGYGFASGHTAVSFALATVVTPHLTGRWRIAPLALAALVGFARIYVGAHLPLDVLGGAGLGIACGALATWVVGASPGRVDVDDGDEDGSAID